MILCRRFSCQSSTTTCRVSPPRSVSGWCRRLRATAWLGRLARVAPALTRWRRPSTCRWRTAIIRTDCCSSRPTRHHQCRTAAPSFHQPPWNHGWWQRFHIRWRFMSGTPPLEGSYVRAVGGVVRIDPLRKTPTNSYIMMCLASKPILIASFQHNEKIDNPLSETVLCIYFASL